MRFFTLIDESGARLSITTKTRFFHEPGGLGFDEEASYFPVAYHHSLLTTTYSQGVISGNMIFVDDSWEKSGKTPYERSFEFTQFCMNKNLQLYYQPHGVDVEGFYRDVRLSKYDKGEISELGVLDVPVEFTCSTPWYRKVTTLRNLDPEDPTIGWVWERDSTDERNTIWKTGKHRGYIRFGVDTRTSRAIIDTADHGKNILPSPATLIIDGPVTNPTWTHYVDGAVAGTGSFAKTVSVSAGEQLVIDSTAFPYGMYIRNTASHITTRDVYQSQNFEENGFITLQSGYNEVTVTGQGGAIPKIILEGHLYYGVV